MIWFEIESEVECPYCEESNVFTSEGELDDRRHSIEQECTCMYCGKEFSVDVMVDYSLYGWEKKHYEYREEL